MAQFGGQRLLASRWMHRFVSPEQVQRASILFGKYGGFATVFGRLVLGTRTALLVASGLLKYRAHKFLAVTVRARNDRVQSCPVIFPDIDFGLHSLAIRMLSQRKYSGQLTLSLPGQRCRCRKKLRGGICIPCLNLKPARPA
jgi:hypothetical protein